jgi:gamma-glutamyltranspeptidase/glutathione hydrolase
MKHSHAVAAGHALTADTAAAILAEGGTAMDAAVAASLVAMVAEPVLAGLLGGGFATVRMPDGSCRVLDMFVQTPRRARPERDLDLRAVEADFGTARQVFHIGAGTIAGCGLAPGLAEAHARLGRMPWAEVVAPAVAAARDGVAVTPFQARLSQIVAPILTATPAARALHTVTAAADEGPEPEPALREAGALWRNPDFAAVLEEFAHEGARFVQEGEVAAAMLTLCDQGGHLTREDFRRYQPRWRVPLEVRRGDARVWLNPPPALGGALVAFGLEVAPQNPTPVQIAAMLVRTARERIACGLDADGAEGAARLLSPDLLARVRADLATRPVAERGTTQISVLDGSGLGVALTLSNGEGCGLIAPGTGIMPNNMLGEDDLLPDGPGAWLPDRRMASMMAPLAVNWPDGRCVLMGSGGSNRIRSALAQVLLHLIDGGRNLEAAISAPRLHVEGGRDGVLDYEESGLREGDRAALRAAWPEARGWDAPSMFFGGVHAVAGDARGGRDACGDARRDGHARVG